MKSFPLRNQLLFQGGLLVLATLLPYLNTFHVPWFFDDLNNIVDNPLIRDLPRAARGIFEKRGVATLTFAVNYRLGGLDPFGYHVVNLLIHVLSALMVWQLLRRLLRGAEWAALGGAALFAVHPVQTQAVTYVVQRMTSLSGLFFFVAVLLYLMARDERLRSQNRFGRRHSLYYGGALIAGGLAVLVKQNAAILPLTLLAAEYLLYADRSEGRAVRRLSFLLPFCVVPLLLAVHQVILPTLTGAELWKIANPTSDRRIEILHYLVTEFSVLWIYLRLLVFPFGQVFDLAYPVVERLATWQNLMAFSGLAGLFALAFFYRNRRPLVAFGILWFLVALVVESTFIPLDPYNEHRLYVPIFGFVLIVVELLRLLPDGRLRPLLCCTVLSLLMLLTWQRNTLWADPILFFEDNLRKSPRNVRVMVMLGNAYAREERGGEALQLFEQARQLNPDYLYSYTAFGKFYIDRGEGGRAIPALLQGVRRLPEAAVLHEYLGVAYGQSGDYRQAMEHFQQALRIKPDDASVLTNIGVAYSWLGDDRQALGYFQRSLQLDPQSEKTLFNYATALYNLGEGARALEMLRELVRTDPGNSTALFARGSLAAELGRRDEAVEARDALRRLGAEARARELDAQLAGGRP